MTLQLLSHLKGNAMNVALLVPEVKRATQAGLERASTEHYGSPGRLANYWRLFEGTTRQEGEDPSTFAITLYTLVVKAFGDMGANAQLQLIRDWFVAGHENCALFREWKPCISVCFRGHWLWPRGSDRVPTEKKSRTKTISHPGRIPPPTGEMISDRATDTADT